MIAVMKLVFIGMIALYAVRLALEQIEWRKKENSSPITKEHRKYFGV